MVLFCEKWKNLSPWLPDSLSCWGQKDDYLPLKLRFTVVCVAKDFQFSGWEKHGFPSCTGKNSPSDLTASVSGSNSTELQWKDNSGTEAGFIIERSLFPNKGLY